MKEKANLLIVFGVALFCAGMLTGQLFSRRQQSQCIYLGNHLGDIEMMQVWTPTFTPTAVPLMINDLGTRRLIWISPTHKPL